MSLSLIVDTTLNIFKSSIHKKSIEPDNPLCMKVIFNLVRFADNNKQPKPILVDDFTV